MAEFHPGSEIQRGDLCVFFVDSCNVRTNLYEITYAIFFVQDEGLPSEMEILIGSPARVPNNPEVGEYYAALFVPPDAQVGTYRIRWIFREVNDASPAQTIVQEFTVIAKGVQQVAYSAAMKACIWRLRKHLMDHAPDRLYHFRPPEHEMRIGQFDRVFGQIWKDEELACYLESALEWWNMQAPETEGLCTIDKLAQQKPAWKVAILFGAMYFALWAMAILWVSEEFDYSIGGISLSIDKSSKYETMKQNAQTQMEKMIETKLATTKIIRGLAQPRLGLGVRSSFGPHVGRGILSPQNFL